jgi:hypothetical protein
MGARIAMSSPQGIYRRISVRLWADERFRQLSPLQPSAQTLWLYLLTGPHTTAIPGAFQCGRAAMAEALGWSRVAFDRCMDEILDAGLAEYEHSTRLWFVPRAIRHNPPANPNVVKSWRSAWLLLPEGQMRRRITRCIADALKDIGPTFLEGFINGPSKASVKVIEEELSEASLKASGKAFAEPSSSQPHMALGAPSPKQKQEQEQQQDFGADAPTLASPASGRSSKFPSCPYEEIMRAYNEVLPELPEARLLNAERRRAIKGLWQFALTSRRTDGARRAEDGSSALAWIRNYFERARHNDFLMGRTQPSANHANWRCDITFLASEKGRVHVLEKTRLAE